MEPSFTLRLPKNYLKKESGSRQRQIGIFYRFSGRSGLSVSLVHLVSFVYLVSLVFLVNTVEILFISSKLKKDLT